MRSINNIFIGVCPLRVWDAGTAAQWAARPGIFQPIRGQSWSPVANQRPWFALVCWQRGCNSSWFGPVTRPSLLLALTPILEHADRRVSQLTFNPSLIPVFEFYLHVNPISWGLYDTCVSVYWTCWGSNRENLSHNGYVWLILYYGFDPFRLDYCFAGA